MRMMILTNSREGERNYIVNFDLPGLSLLVSNSEKQQIA